MREQIKLRGDNLAQHLALFDSAQEVHQVVAIDFVDGPPAERWLGVFFEESQDLRECALTPLSKLLQQKTNSVRVRIQDSHSGLKHTG